MRNDPDAVQNVWTKDAVRNVWTKGAPARAMFDRDGVCNKCRGHGEVWRGYPPRLTCDVCQGRGTA